MRSSQIPMEGSQGTFHCPCISAIYTERRFIEIHRPACNTHALSPQCWNFVFRFYSPNISHDFLLQSLQHFKSNKRSKHADPQTLPIQKYGIPQKLATTRWSRGAVKPPFIQQHTDSWVITKFQRFRNLHHSQLLHMHAASGEN